VLNVGRETVTVDWRGGTRGAAKVAGKKLRRGREGRQGYSETNGGAQGVEGPNQADLVTWTSLITC